MKLGKNQVKVPEKIPYNRDGKDDIQKYILQFDRINGLKSVSYTFGEKK